MNWKTRSNQPKKRRGAGPDEGDMLIQALLQDLRDEVQAKREELQYARRQLTASTRAEGSLADVVAQRRAGQTAVEQATIDLQNAELALERYENDLVDFIQEQLRRLYGPAGSKDNPIDLSSARARERELREEGAIASYAACSEHAGSLTEHTCTRTP